MILNIIFYVTLTALLLITFYYGTRVRVMRSYIEEYPHFDEYYNKEVRKFAIIAFITAITAIIGFIVT